MKSTTNKEIIHKKLKLKVMQGITLNEENLKDLVLIIKTNDTGWNYDDDLGVNYFVQTHEVRYLHYTYTLRVNLSWGMITLLEIGENDGHKN